MVTYLDETWLAYKEKFVSTFLRGKLHFSHTTTSRVVCAHSALKKRNLVSTGNLLIVDAACRLACDSQIAAIRLQSTRERAIADMPFGQVFAGAMEKFFSGSAEISFQLIQS